MSGSADGDDRDIEAVEALVGSHIEKENCLILLAVTCESERTHLLSRLILIFTLQPTLKIREDATSPENMTPMEIALFVSRKALCLQLLTIISSCSHQARPNPEW